MGPSGGRPVDLDLITGGLGDPTTYMRDGVRKIDFVLVFEEKLSAAGVSEQEQAEAMAAVMAEQSEEKQGR